VLELALLLRLPPYAAVMVTVPAVFPVIVMKQLPFAREHVVELSVTAPVPDWDHVTVPMGE